MIISQFYIDPAVDISRNLKLDNFRVNEDDSLLPN